MRRGPAVAISSYETTCLGSPDRRPGQMGFPRTTGPWERTTPDFPHGQRACLDGLVRRGYRRSYTPEGSGTLSGGSIRVRGQALSAVIGPGGRHMRAVCTRPVSAPPRHPHGTELPRPPPPSKALHCPMPHARRSGPSIGGMIADQTGPRTSPQESPRPDSLPLLATGGATRPAHRRGRTGDSNRHRGPGWSASCGSSAICCRGPCHSQAPRSPTQHQPPQHDQTRGPNPQGATRFWLSGGKAYVACAQGTDAPATLLPDHRSPSVCHWSPLGHPGSEDLCAAGSQPVSHTGCVSPAPPPSPGASSPHRRRPTVRTCAESP